MSWQERESMIQEYLTGNFSKIEIWKKYTGQNEEHGQMLKWMRKLGYISEESMVRRPIHLYFKNTNSPNLSKERLKNESEDELKRRIKELEKLLEIERLRSEGYELMIDIAEKELKIPIRKKSDTK